jgi:hypothetical protein
MIRRKNNGLSIYNFSSFSTLYKMLKINFEKEIYAIISKQNVFEENWM